ncbi:MAG TPA: glycosyltransferase family 4 protein [Thermoanaerobaculia bacterium]|nr:glycosyltransferase family 4 protein [Thermoanaerobaculia bacterium]
MPRLASLRTSETPSALSSRGLRIAFIGARGVGGTYSGIETYYEEVGSRLAARGHQVTAYCRNHFTPAVSHYRGIEVRRLPTLRTKHFETASHSLLSTVDSLRRGFDVVQYHAIGSAPLCFLPRLAGAATVVSVRGLDWQRAKWGWMARTALRMGEWASARLPTGTVVVSDTLRSHYREVHGREPHLIPNPVPPVERCGLGGFVDRGLEPRSYLLFAGRVSPEKHVHTLIEAAAPLLDRVQLVIAGGSSHSDAYVSEVRALGGDRVHFLGQVDREAMRALLSNAFAFVLPSALEGLSIGLLEALAYGNCIVASDIPENREVVGGAGLYVPVGDAESLRETLALLVREPDRAARLRRRALERAAELPDWDRVAELTESFFFSCCRPDRVSRGRK